MPLKDVWMHLWCYYKYNDVKVKRIGEAVEDIKAILKDAKPSSHDIGEEEF